MCEMFADKELSVTYENNQCQASQPTGIVPEVAPGSDRGVKYWTPTESMRRGNPFTLVQKFQEQGG